MAIFTRKHLCWNLFSIKLQAWRSASVLKSDSNTGVFLWILPNFKENLFYTTASESKKCTNNKDHKRKKHKESNTHSKKQITKLSRIMAKKAKIKYNYLLRQKNILKPRRFSALSKKISFFLFLLFLFSVNFFVLTILYCCWFCWCSFLKILLFWNKVKAQIIYFYCFNNPVFFKRYITGIYVT